VARHFSRLAQGYALAVGLIFASPSYADDIFKGARGPIGKDWQIDERVACAVYQESVQISNNFILKYWTGDAAGKWVFVNVPYKLSVSEAGSKAGLGDISVGAGPRGRIGSLHWISYAGMTFPSGETNEKIKLGTGRLDKKFGLFVTYNGTVELEGALEHNFTGRRDGLAVPDETYWGLLAGGKLTDKIRAVSGLTETHKENGSFLLNSRSVARYTVSPKMHFEVVADIGLDSKNIPLGKSVGIYQRYNF